MSDEVVWFGFAESIFGEGAPAYRDAREASGLRRFHVEGGVAYVGGSPFRNAEQFQGSQQWLGVGLVLRGVLQRDESVHDGLVLRPAHLDAWLSGGDVVPGPPGDLPDRGGGPAHGFGDLSTPGVDVRHVVLGRNAAHVVLRGPAKRRVPIFGRTRAGRPTTPTPVPASPSRASGLAS